MSNINRIEMSVKGQVSKEEQKTLKLEFEFRVLGNELIGTVNDKVFLQIRRDGTIDTSWADTFKRVGDHYYSLNFDNLKKYQEDKKS